VSQIDAELNRNGHGKNLNLLVEGLVRIPKSWRLDLNRVCTRRFPLHFPLRCRALRSAPPPHEPHFRQSASDPSTAVCRNRRLPTPYFHSPRSLAAVRGREAAALATAMQRQSGSPWARTSMTASGRRRSRRRGRGWRTLTRRRKGADRAGRSPCGPHWSRAPSSRAPGLFSDFSRPGLSLPSFAATLSSAPSARTTRSPVHPRPRRRGRVVSRLASVRGPT
jgi:hypothetical protein